MSKFCTNCGKEILDDATVCPECNADLTSAQPEVQQAAPAAEPTSFTVTLPSKDEAINKIKKHWKVGAIIAGVVVVAIIVGVLLSGGGYKGAIKDYMNFICDGKVSNVEGFAPEKYWEEIEDEYDVSLDDLEDDLQDEYEESVEDKDIKYSYEIKDSEQMDKDDLEDLAESIHDKYDFIDEDDVTDAYEVEVEITMEEDDDKDDYDMDLRSVKIDGKWYPMSGSSFVTDSYMYRYEDYDDYY